MYKKSETQFTRSECIENFDCQDFILKEIFPFLKDFRLKIQNNIYLYRLCLCFQKNKRIFIPYST